MLLPNDSTRTPCRTEAGTGLLPVTVHGRRAGTQLARCCSESAQQCARQKQQAR